MLETDASQNQLWFWAAQTNLQIQATEAS